MRRLLLISVLLFCTGCAAEPAPTPEAENTVPNASEFVITTDEPGVYENKEVGVTFEFPTSWEIEDLTSLSTKNDRVLLGMGEPGKEDKQVWMYVFEETDIDTAIYRHLSNYVGASVGTSEDITVDGLPGKNVGIVFGEDKMVYRWIFLQGKTQVYVFGITFDVEPYSGQFDDLVESVDFAETK